MHNPGVRSGVPSTSGREIARPPLRRCRSRFDDGGGGRGGEKQDGREYRRACLRRGTVSACVSPVRRISRISFVSLSRGWVRHVGNDTVTIHLTAHGPLQAHTCALPRGRKYANFMQRRALSG